MRASSGSLPPEKPYGGTGTWIFSSGTKHSGCMAKNSIAAPNAGLTQKAAKTSTVVEKQGTRTKTPIELARERHAKGLQPPRKGAKMGSGGNAVAIKERHLPGKTKIKG